MFCRDLRHNICIKDRQTKHFAACSTSFFSSKISYNSIKIFKNKFLSYNGRPSQICNICSPNDNDKGVIYLISIQLRSILKEIDSYPFPLESANARTKVMTFEKDFLIEEKEVKRGLRNHDQISSGIHRKSLRQQLSAMCPTKHIYPILIWTGMNSIWFKVLFIALIKMELEWNQIEHNFRLKRFNRLYCHFIFHEWDSYKNQRIHFQPWTFLICTLFSLLIW